MRQTAMTTKPQPAEPENLACPRCESTNTKFCYYNNYNLSQPRYFCKACRRYWTRGGTLRNVPIGGGSRKNSKRPRSSSAVSSAPLPPPPPPTLSTTSSSSGIINLNVNDATSFMSLLTSTAATHHDPPPPPMGLGQDMGLGGYGYGYGFGFGFGSSRVGESDGGVMMGGGDCMTWAPELAISMKKKYSHTDLTNFLQQYCANVPEGSYEKLESPI
ncbi:hypothetical protein Cgig2_021232 [Carnegiea gigantea]|uniref:Dof zinc finger protein n=1 Tax=Carnegiea gigantea TaxID=171969 RepID=A0A9Q1KX93_9CARY|nr:hypothetical protein Cgig2_021232 [Carnegiea gigantea]